MGTRAFRVVARRLPASFVLLLAAAAGAAGQAPDAEGGHGLRHHLEVFPIMVPFRVYSAQYAYRWTPRTELIVGLAYVNVEVEDRHGTVVGELRSPTVPLGVRRYLRGQWHVEAQLWPAYNFYRDRIEERSYPGFDLYGEVRAGYRFDFHFARLPVLLNLQYVYGAGILPGNKPDRFLEAVEDAPAFHVPSISVGVRF